MAIKPDREREREREISCCGKIQDGLICWYKLAQAVLETGQ